MGHFLEMIALFDSVAERWLPLSAFESVADFVRVMSMAVSDVETARSPLSRHPEQFRAYRFARFDSLQGVLDAKDPEFLGDVRTLVDGFRRVHGDGRQGELEVSQ